ncbi:MAG: hypothetical protein NZ610_01690 [Candidatus Bipolaricaulota bacterium]|nr:hypothetical protein [Candidatus Bipolaricaulota bacterium]MCS7274105.1 hypothetical protein [Candidatus Bipolaricaulota bacterium]MDW8111278.1 hypothetical protein [Candidatus Bipolaricaulota bacterium]MDW8328586.1 hypothetical protein [Candidatus Bipolaricaulota bacterium]
MSKKISSKIPRFRSVTEERRFWETHDAFDTLGEEGWEVVEAGTPVRSLYVVRVGRHGALVRIPKAFLKQLRAKNGQKLRVWTEGSKLILETE